MRKEMLILVLALATGGAARREALTMRPTTRPADTPFETHAVLVPDNAVDKAVKARLAELGIEPAAVCSDAVFVRRVYLDVIGTLPTAQEVQAFLADRSFNKRSALIDKLLSREEFADYWAMKWCDLLRVKAEFPINLWPNAVQAYHRWICSSIRENKPYDRFVREMLTASGSNFRDPPVNFYRAVQSKTPEGLAQAVALTFMGTRTETWPKEKRDGMASFFSRVGYKATGEWKEEIVFFDRSKAGPESATFPDGRRVRLEADRDPREVFADWLIDGKNPWFARNIANRVWSWLLGRGIIHEPDDIRPDNPPVNPELLALLERELFKSGYDLRQLYRLILNSRTYQQASIPRADREKAEANFAVYPLRRLEAEVLIDALNQITGSTERYSSAIPEPFTFIPADHRSIALADGSITSSFLELFGRPARDTGLEGERNNRPTASQRLHMLNSSHIQRKIENSAKLGAMLQARRGREAIDAIYLTILSRYPTGEELMTIGSYVRQYEGRGREAMVDLVWALFNSAEFLYRH